MSKLFQKTSQKKLPRFNDELCSLNTTEITQGIKSRTKHSWEEGCTGSLSTKAPDQQQYWAVLPNLNSYAGTLDMKNESSFIWDAAFWKQCKNHAWNKHQQLRQVKTELLSTRFTHSHVPFFLLFPSHKISLTWSRKNFLCSSFFSYKPWSIRQRDLFSESFVFLQETEMKCTLLLNTKKNLSRIPTILFKNKGTNKETKTLPKNPKRQQFFRWHCTEKL